MNADNFTINIC